MSTSEKGAKQGSGGSQGSDKKGPGGRPSTTGEKSGKGRDNAEPKPKR